MELFKLRVQNLGRIKDAELSIRPLTVFVGPNNTNKTWTAYALYGLAKRLSGGTSRFWRRPDADAVPLVHIDSQLKEVTNSKVSRIASSVAAMPADAIVQQEVARAELIEKLAYPVRLILRGNGLAAMLAVAEDVMPLASATIEIAQEQFSASILSDVSFELRKQEGIAEAAFRYTKMTGRHHVINSGIAGEIDPKFQDFLEQNVELLLLWQFYGVHVFPAERKALVAVNNVLQASFTDLLSRPVVDFVSLLRRGRAEREYSERVLHLSDVASLLEEKLLDGKLDFEGDATTLTLGYACQGGPNLRMHATSSLVRALAGLDVYFKYVARPNDLIVIDEPEMNAHPEAQLMITELLGVLVNKGINVVVTTHSPYVVDHVNNLIEAAHLPEAKRDEMASRFRLQSKEAFVPSEKVATYLFNEDGSVSDILDRETRIIDWATFGSTSDDVTNLYSDILESAGQK